MKSIFGHYVGGYQMDAAVAPLVKVIRLSYSRMQEVIRRLYIIIFPSTGRLWINLVFIA